MNKKRIPYLLYFFLVAPWTYLLIEVILIEMKWGLDALNNYSTLSSVVILLIVVLLPAVCGLIMDNILRLFAFEVEDE